MIRLGTHDLDVSQDLRTRYADLLKKTTRVSLSDVASGHDKLEFHPRPEADGQSMSVSEVQKALKDLGFFPGGAVDGLCGYRTRSAIRLFQEYVRSVEGLGGVPDGLFGPNTERHLKRWLDEGLAPDWAPVVARWKAGDLAGTEYARWLELGRKVQAKYAAEPTRTLRMVKEFGRTTDTHPVEDWDFGPDAIHLFGVRRNQFSGKFDDVFVLLLKGLVFKFQGSTEPGSTTNTNGRPFLVQGQHDYHFGWHKKEYLALRPKRVGGGVLVVRSKNDEVLDDSDLDKGLSANGSINIHWAGMGLEHDVKNWSAGCQVITGSLYVNHRGDLVDCADFVATNNDAVSNAKTRGAYSLMVDLATALAGDLESAEVRYTLLEEEDLELDPVIRDDLARVRATAMERARELARLAR